MNRFCRQSIGWSLLLGLLAFVTASARAEDKKPDDILKDKGLAKSGVFYLLKDDASIGEDLRKFRLAKNTNDADTKKRLECEGKIKNAKSMMAQMDYEARGLNDKLSRGIPDVEQHNKAVGRINVLMSQMKEGDTFVHEREVEMSTYNASREAYINAAMELTEKMEKILKDYEALAKDTEVQGALTILGDKVKPKPKLGPSAEFTSNLVFVKKQRGDINSAIVKIKVEDHIPTVEVTLNGKMTRTMILDSGASVVAVTSNLAKELGLIPGPQDPVIHMRLADGKVVDARQMYLKSVRVGQFTIENVECAVLPASLIAAEDLLGGSFLRNFVYKLDPEAGELHLAQIGGKKDTSTPPPVGGAKKEMPAKDGAK